MAHTAKKKTFLLDTNVILHDSSCIYAFEEHDIAVPITVLEELDRFKKGNEILNYHAREFVRTLDALSGDRLFNGGVKIGQGHGRITVKLECEFHPDLALTYEKSKPDHRILNIAYHLIKEQPKQQIVLVTKDVNLRMKAKSLGLMSQDYTTDHIKDINTLYRGHRIEEQVPEQVIEQLYGESGDIDPGFLPPQRRPLANEYLVLRNGRKSALSTLNPGTGTFKRVDKTAAYGIVPRNAEQTFALHALMNPAVRLTSLTGKAGTGKTLLALAGALEKRKHYQQIYIARPIVPLSNRDSGYLPGDISSKLDPYMQPIYDNLGVIRNQLGATGSRHKKIEEFLEQQKLVVSPLSYIRGRSLVGIYFIVDEAQNLTPHEVKTIITRAGEGTKIVFTGDIFQIDHPYLDTYSNGLSCLIDKMQGQDLYAHINLEKGERSELAELATNIL